MDLKHYSKKDILLSALKSEIDSERVYLELAKRVKNFLLADRLKFLAQEEKNHAAYLKALFKAEFPGEQPKIPAESVIPFPEIDIVNESIAMSDLLDQAKQAEDVAATFYSSMISIFTDVDQNQPLSDETNQRLASVRDSLLYLATMEIGHSKILETEADHARKNEHDTMEWNMIHEGP
jgi:rubrerythrin